jgi:hypothetical protein
MASVSSCPKYSNIDHDCKLKQKPPVIAWRFHVYGAALPLLPQRKKPDSCLDGTSATGNASEHCRNDTGCRNNVKGSRGRISKWICPALSHEHSHENTAGAQINARVCAVHVHSLPTLPPRLLSSEELRSEDLINLDCNRKRLVLQ